MIGEILLQWTPAIGSLLLVVFTALNARRANKTSEKKLTLDEQQAEDTREDAIAENRRVELERLYARVDKLEKIVESLQQRDAEKQETINAQRQELGRTNEELAQTVQLLTDVRKLFFAFVGRVEFAWESQHDVMPALTRAERALLEDTLPGRRT